MKVNVETVSPVERKLSVEMDPEQVAKELERAYKGLARRVKVPGFRQGKVPRRILEARYKAEVEQDVVQHLVEHGYRDAIKDQDFIPVATPVVTPEKLEPGQAFRFEARVEIKPHVEAKEYRGLVYSPTEVEVTDEMVKEELTRLQDQLAQFVPVEDRHVGATGDYAVISYSGMKDGEEIAGGSGEGITVKIDEGTLLEGNAPMLAGVEVGATVETDVEFPEDYSVESLRGEVGKFTVTLESLKAREVPELDDELAKDLGGEAQTLAELEVEIRERLEKSLKQRAERENREKIQRALVEKNPIEVPNAMVESGIDQSITQTFQRFAGQGINPNDLQLDFAQIRNELRGDVTYRVKAALLLESIAEIEKIEVAEEDYEAHYASLAADVGMEVDQVRAHFQRNAEEREALEERLKEDKALDLLLREATTEPTTV